MKNQNSKFIIYEDSIKLTEKQKQVAKLLSDKTKNYYLFYGGSRSGKTYLACLFIRHRARFYPKSKHLVARYSFANAKKTVWLQTLYPLVREDEQRGLCRINRQEGVVMYNNDSYIILGGLEPSRIDSVLAAEYATILITEANENKYENVEILFSRLNSNAVNFKNEKIVPKLIMDINPTTKHHWTYKLFIQGIDPISNTPKKDFDRYISIHFKPEDNKENLSDTYIERLKNLSYSMRMRFYEGVFASYEGLVFSIFDEAVHLVDDFEIPNDWDRHVSIDFGYTHPFAMLWGAYDKTNDVLYIYREYKQSRMTVRQHIERLKPILNKEKIKKFISDHYAEDRATLEEMGIKTIPADKRKLLSIDKTIDLFSYTDEKKPNIKIFRSCVNLVSELYTYRWKEAEMSNRSFRDREVVKEDDDLIDCLLYMVMEVFPDKNKIPGFILDVNESNQNKFIRF